MPDWYNHLTPGEQTGVWVIVAIVIAVIWKWVRWNTRGK